MAGQHRLLAKDLALVLLLVTAVASAQDRCFNALPLLNGLTAGNNIGATTGSDPVMICGSAFKDVWYAYVAPCSGVVTVNTCNPSTNFDTVLAAWEGSCGCNALLLLDCNDDFCGTRSQITFTAAAGATYYVTVAGFNGASGSFTLSVTCVPGVPTNDQCLGSIPIPFGRRIIGTNVGATQSAGIGCGPHADVWYSFVSGIFGAPITVTTCNSVVGGVTTFDTVIGVFSGACGSLTQVPGACNDDTCGLQSSVTFIGGLNQYYIQVGGFAGATGTFGLKVDQAALISLTFWDQGPGTIGYRIAGAFPYYYLFATLNAGTFPNGWFYGIDLSFADLTNELAAGYPFHGPLSVCGTNGPFGPLPSGLTVYAVALGATGAGAYPNAFGGPVSFTVP